MICNMSSNPTPYICSPAQVMSRQIFMTPPGGFPCKTIMHVCGERDASVIKTLAKEIVVKCENGHYQSVAIPAICAGQ